MFENLKLKSMSRGRAVRSERVKWFVEGTDLGDLVEENYILIRSKMIKFIVHS